MKVDQEFLVAEEKLRKLRGVKCEQIKLVLASLGMAVGEIDPGYHLDEFVIKAYMVRVSSD